MAVTRVREARVYGFDSPHSYFRDQFAHALLSHPDHGAANERLTRYGRELAELQVDPRTRDGVEARMAKRIVGETRRQRTSAGESRAMTTANGSAGAFVTPAHLLTSTVPYHTYEASFALQTNTQELPEHGLDIYIPAWASPASVTVQSGEGAVVANSSPDGAYLQTTLSTVVGEIDVSQQLWDRVGGGASADALITAQLQQQLWTAIDSYLLTAALAGAGTVTQAGTSFTTAQLFGDLGRAAFQTETAPGLVAAPTHAFLTPALYEYAASQVDNNGRPVFSPVPDGAYAPIVPGGAQKAPVGYTGQKILNRHVFLDGNIPEVGAATQIVTGDMREVYSFIGDPMVSAFPETLANELEVVFQLRCYVGLIARYPKAIQTISSTTGAYPAAPTYA